MGKSVALKLAGAAALAGSTQAYGQIVELTLPANLTLPTPTNSNPNFPDESFSFAGENYIVQPSSSIGPDFYFSAFFSNPSPYFGTAVYSLKAGNGVAGTYANGSFYASALATGTRIGSDTLTFDTAALANPNPYAFLAASSDGANSANPRTFTNAQLPNTPVYIGFQFKDGLNNVHDGWLELNSTLSGGPTSPGGLTFIAGAYNSVADTGTGAGDILVGEVPEPGTISSLVLGAAALVGVGLLRRRRASLTA
jgi:hypothetical protein